MSSEYSSEGERDPYKGSGLDPPLAEGVWEEIRRTMADQGIDAGQKAQRKTRRGKDIEVKVLEVRTPRWRSEVVSFSLSLPYPFISLVPDNVIRVESSMKSSTS